MTFLSRALRLLKGVAMVTIASCVMACDAAPQQDASDTALLSFNVARVRLVGGSDTTYLGVELAQRSEQHTMGLMERKQLADSAGMLFLYPVDQPADAGFWMFRTRIPLDIAFVDSLGVIGAIKHMVPCTSTLAEGCPAYPPAVPYRAALEVNAGYFDQHKLAVGSRLILSDTSKVVPAHARK
jgi:uncharacterized membrane protein (UPF0127 family)